MNLCRKFSLIKQFFVKRQIAFGKLRLNIHQGNVLAKDDENVILEKHLA